MGAVLALSLSAFAGSDGGFDATVSEAANTVKDGAHKLAQNVGLAGKAADARLMQESQAYLLRGTVSHTGSQSLQISRPGMPAAELTIRTNSVLLLDGHGLSKVSQFPEGAVVRAKFQLEGGEAIAVKVEATSR